MEKEREREREREREKIRQRQRKGDRERGRSRERGKQSCLHTHRNVSRDSRFSTANGNSRKAIKMVWKNRGGLKDDLTAKRGLQLNQAERDEKATATKTEANDKRLCWNVPADRPMFKCFWADNNYIFDWLEC